MGWARNDERRPCFVDQNTVNFVHDGKVMVLLMHIIDAAAHVVAQVIKAQFVIRRIGDVTGIGRVFFILGLLGVHNTRCHAQCGEYVRHPIGIASCQIIVDRHNMDAFSRQGIQIGGEGCDQGFTFACFHFGDVALVQENTTHQLYIKSAQT